MDSTKLVNYGKIVNLRSAIIKEFKPSWELNDEAHRLKHFEAVFQCGLVINKTLKLGYDPKLILFAAYFHDLFAWNRETHHELSYVWFATAGNKLIRENLDLGEQALVAKACREHRASFKGEFSNEFCELINSADRELPKGVVPMLERAIQYRKKLYPDQSELYWTKDAIAHLKEKYGKDGYARYPDMYRKCFGEQLEQQQAVIETL